MSNEFNDITEKLSQMISNNVNVGMFINSRNRFAEKTTHMMIKDLKKRIEQDNVKKPDNQMIEDVIRLNKDVIYAMVVNKMEDDVKEFVSIYSLTSFNWGNAIENKEVIRTAQAIKNLVDFQNSMLAMISVAQIFHEYAKQFQSFNPPAFHMSKSYLESLYNDIDEEVDLNDRNK